MPASNDQKKYLVLTYLYNRTLNPDLIEISTGWYRTFDRDPENLVAPTKKVASDIPDHINPDMIESVKAIWDELLAVSIGEIEQEIENWNKRKWQEEQDQYFFLSTRYLV
ncbi:MAG: hypothetical protein ABJH45_15475 [Paracoccaceae bacterium]